MVIAVTAGGGLLDASAQFNDAELKSAVISMKRESHCGFVQPDPKTSASVQHPTSWDVWSSEWIR